MRIFAIVTSLALATPAFAAGKFTLHSTDVKPNGQLSDEQVFNGFGCSGANVSPQLTWENAPAGTKTLARWPVRSRAPGCSKPPVGAPERRRSKPR